MRQTRLLVLAATGAVLTLTAACGANSAADKSAGSQQKMKTVAMQLPDAKVRASWPKQDVASGLAKGMRLPLEKYMLGYPDMVDIENAKDVVKSACMKRLGFSYTPELMGTQPAASYNEMNMERRYGITDPAKAAAHGFAVAQDTGGPSQADQDAELAREDQESSAEGWDKAMNDTCIPEANQKVGVILPEDPAEDLAGQSLKATRSRPDVQRALSTWSSCMAGHGHQVKSLDDARDDSASPAGPGFGLRRQRCRWPPPTSPARAPPAWCLPGTRRKPPTRTSRSLRTKRSWKLPRLVMPCCSRRHVPSWQTSARHAEPSCRHITEET
ncbi:hypothetical protein [Streptomyces griseofuscus]|uniref:hypothetical protein n=1 Tax=Streptomyces griseofuscus TaxID=146922 RepID=UPI003454F194